MSARCGARLAARAAACSRSKAIVAPSGSCSSSALADWAASMMSACSRSRPGQPAQRRRPVGGEPGARIRAGELIPLHITRLPAGASRNFDSVNVGLIRQAVFMAETLTLMAVHAHPDDEASSTGGVLAHYSAAGRPHGGRDLH